jgi:tryprostatin B 6-hydroxylase
LLTEGIGVYGCLGKQLAYMEIRTVITFLVLNYKISFAPGEDGTEFWEDTVDIFTLSLKELKLVFEKIETA